MTRMRRTGRILLGFLVAYVLAFQGMAGAFAAARHVPPLQAGVLCSGEPVPHDGAPAPMAHERACDLFCNGFAGAALPPAPAVPPLLRLSVVTTADALGRQTLRRTPAYSPQQPRAPPFAI